MTYTNFILVAMTLCTFVYK